MIKKKNCSELRPAYTFFTKKYIFSWVIQHSISYKQFFFITRLNQTNEQLLLKFCYHTILFNQIVVLLVKINLILALINRQSI